MAASLEDKIKAMLSCLSGEEEMKREMALKCVINLAYQDRFRDAIVANGGIQKLASLLSDDDEVLQMLAAWALSNLCSDHEHYQAVLGKSGVIEACLPIIISSHNTDVLEKVLWLITNISRNPDNRRTMFSGGYMPALSALLARNVQQVQVVELLRNIFQDPLSQEEFCGLRSGSSEESLSRLVNGLSDRHSAVLRAEIALTIAVLCSSSDDVRRKVSETGVLNHLKMLITDRISADDEENYKNRDMPLSEAAVMHSVWCLTNLSLCADQEVNILQSGLLGPLLDLVSSSNPSTAAEVTVLLANLSLNDDVRAAVRKLGGIPVITATVKSSARNPDAKNLLSEVLQLIINLSVDRTSGDITTANNILEITYHFAAGNAYLFGVTKCKDFLSDMVATADEEVRALLDVALANISVGIERRNKASALAKLSGGGGTRAPESLPVPSDPPPPPPTTAAPSPPTSVSESQSLRTVQKTVPRRSSLRFTGSVKPLIQREELQSATNSAPDASPPAHSGVEALAKRPSQDGWRRSAAVSPAEARTRRTMNAMGVRRSGVQKPMAIPEHLSKTGRSDSTVLMGELDGRHVRRTNIVKEMLDTEESYVEGLRTLIKMYLRPLHEALDKKPILTKDEIRRMFSFVEVIVNINEEFLAKLRERVEAWTETTEVGDVYLHLCQMLPMYSEYINNYNRSMETMSQCVEENVEFLTFIQETRLLPECKGLDISSYLILPIQRVPRYQMMLDDLLKRTAEDHPDFNNLSQAVAKIKDTAEFLNEAKRASENLAKVVAIQEQLTGFSGCLVQADRKLIKEGPALLSVHGGSSKYIYLLLFSDMMMFTDKKKNKLKFRTMLTLSSIRIVNMTDTEVLKNAVEILGKKPDGEPTDFQIYFSNPIDKQDWMGKMKDAIHIRKKVPSGNKENWR